MSTDTKEQLELSIEEGKDGSAVVDLPENMINDDEPEAKNTPEQGKAEGGDVSDEDQDHPDDDQALREAKRSRRRAKKELIRKTNEEKDIRLQQLQRENEEFKRRLSNVERETKQSQISRIDKNIEDSQVRLEYAKMKLKEAAENSDGDAMVDAQTLWREAENQLAQLQSLKQRASQEVQEPRHELPDPTVQRNAAEWMRRNSWYNPEANDSDSRIAKKVDELLVTEGWNPSDPDYWDELDSRLQKSLPHRYNQSSDDNSVVRKPRNVVGSSGREASAAFGGNNRSQFMLSPERVKAMKEIGAWDNPERKKKMIAEFIKFDRLNRN